MFYSTVGPLAQTIAREQSDPRPASAADAQRVLDWLIYSHLTIGGAYDSNVVASPTQQPAYGSRFQPYVVAEKNNGIERTLIYGTGDIRYYPSLHQTDVMNSAAGVAHVWEIERDLVFRTQFEASRGMDSSALTGTIPGVLYTQPTNYTSLFDSTSIQKNFGNFFTAVGASVTGATYDSTQDNLGNVISEQFRNGTMSTLNGRVGYHVTPLVYTFVEPSLMWGRYTGSNLDSNGYRIVGGIGTDRISLFNGEIYGGTLTERFSDSIIPTLTGGTFGGKISWFPTYFVTITASEDQSIGTSDFSVGLFTPGSVTKIDASKLSASWSASNAVTLEARILLKQYQFLGSFRRDDSTEIGATVTYKLTSRFSLVIDFGHVDYVSNLVGAGYKREFVSVGGDTKF